MKNKLTQAFSLIELMVVMAITAILIAVAIPNYKAYVIRAHVAEMLAMIDFCQNNILRTFVNTGSFPNLAIAEQRFTCQGILMQQGTVHTIPNISDGRISISYSRNSSGSTAGFTLTHQDVHERNQDPCNLYIILTQNNGDLQHTCSTACTTRDFFPANCNTGVATNPFA